jgi:hypothetical protein
MNLSNEKVSSVDELPTQKGILSKVFYRCRNRLRNHWISSQGRKYFTETFLLDYKDLHQRIGDEIRASKPLAVGRLGGVEALIVLWARGIPNATWRLDLKPLFSDTAQGATNAGIRPRNPESYHLFSRIAWDALECLDFQGVWKSGPEALVLQRLPPRALFDVEIAGPDGSYRNHWSSALKGKRVLVVSPFEETILSQLARMKSVWPNLDWFEGTQFVTTRFPYLIDEGCEETWWGVYERIGKTISEGNYDVALFGCGGLGLPFAMLAKQAGRVGIHLGGHLQLLFGIYGQRHLHHDWHRKHLNEAWVRPDENEVPVTAKRVEGGCYW